MAFGKDVKVSHIVGYVALRCAMCLIQTISLESCDRICKVLAWIVSDFTSLRKSVTEENLRRVYGDISPEHVALLRRRMWHSLLLMVCEIAHAPRKIHRTNWRDHIYMHNKEATVRMMMDPRATIIVSGHFGNFEVAGHAVGCFGLPPHTMARPLDNPLVDDYLTKFRSSGGQTILPKEGSAAAVQDLLDNKGTLAILADQHAGEKGCWVDFFGHPTSCHKALALFTLSAGAPMVVNYTRRLDRPLRFELGTIGIADPALLDQENPPEYLQGVNDLTEWYNAHLEKFIRLAPEQYWWLHRRWREVPAKQLKRLAARRKRKLARTTAKPETPSGTLPLSRAA